MSQRDLIETPCPNKNKLKMDRNISILNISSLQFIILLRRFPKWCNRKLTSKETFLITSVDKIVKGHHRNWWEPQCIPNKRNHHTLHNCRKICRDFNLLLFLVLWVKMEVLDSRFRQWKMGNKILVHQWVVVKSLKEKG